VSKKTGRPGYAPACSNKFVRGVCDLPKVKCSECPNQAFVSVSDRIVLDHLQGRHVMGMYPPLCRSGLPPAAHRYDVELFERKFFGDSPSKLSDSACGDGVLDAGEVCDDGNFDNTDSCSVRCIGPVCGDGIIDGAEECDDGNLWWMATAAPSSARCRSAATA